MLLDPNHVPAWWLGLFVASIMTMLLSPFGLGSISKLAKVQSEQGLELALEPFLLGTIEALNQECHPPSGHGYCDKVSLYQQFLAAVS